MQDIVPPFANYHPAELERLVQEWYDLIEERAAWIRSTFPVSYGTKEIIPQYNLVTLLAAEKYLQQLKQQEKDNNDNNSNSSC